MRTVSQLVVIFCFNALWQISLVALLANLAARLMGNLSARYHQLLWLSAMALVLLLPLNWSNRFLHPEMINVSASKLGNSQPMVQGVTVPSTGTINISHWRELADRLLTRDSLISIAAVIIAILYLLFLAYRLLQLWQAWQRTMTIYRSAYQRELPALFSEVLAESQQLLGLSNVRLLCSELVRSPLTVGSGNPMIILPAELFNCQSRELLTTIFGHELVHIKNRDFIINIICELVLLPFSFHPAAKYIRQRINETRELLCDEVVSERMLDAHSYANSLVMVARTMVKSELANYTLGVFDATTLEKRVMRLINRRLATGANQARLIFVLGVLLLVVGWSASAALSLTTNSNSAAIAINFKHGSMVIVAQDYEGKSEFLKPGVLSGIMVLATRNVSLKVDDAKLSVVEAELNRQTDLGIKLSHPDQNFQISIDIKDVPLQDLLKFFSDNGAQISVNGVDYLTLETGRKALLRAAVFISIQGANFDDVAATLTNLSGKRIKYENADGNKKINLTSEKLSLTELLQRIAKENSFTSAPYLAPDQDSQN